MTSYEIDKLVDDGHLTRYANGMYENTGFKADVCDGQIELNLTAGQAVAINIADE